MKELPRSSHDHSFSSAEAIKILYRQPLLFKNIFIAVFVQYLALGDQCSRQGQTILLHSVFLALKKQRGPFLLPVVSFCH